MIKTSERHDPLDNPRLLCQDLDRKLFNWFLSRIDWKRILKGMNK